MESNIKFDLPQEDTNIIKVVGVGGGGNNAVNYMHMQGICGVDFAICNTDRQALEASAIEHKIQLGPELTDGKGAGNKPEVGRQACIESINDIKSFLAKDTKMLFVTAGMGGGTGTGAAPIIAKTAKEMGILTIGIVTKPFGFEGRKRQVNGDNGIEELRKNVDTLVVISNDKLHELYPDYTMKQAFGKADDILAIAAKGIAEIITKPGYINVDFMDVHTVMKDSGVAVMGTGVSEGEDRATKAVTKALSSPLLENNDINGAQSILINITTGKDDFTMTELKVITDSVQDAAGEADLIWGNCYDEEMGNSMMVTVIATGFDRSDNKEQTKKQIQVQDDQMRTQAKKEIISLDGDDDLPFEIDSTSKKHVFSFDLGDNRNSSVRVHDRDAQVVTQDRESRRKVKKTAIDPSKLDTDRLQEFESVPAYVRKKIYLEDEQKGDMTVSEFTLNQEDEVKQNNSYLHKTVD